MTTVSPEYTDKLHFAYEYVTLPHQDQTSFAKAEGGIRKADER
jgi:hypothetical protein